METNSDADFLSTANVTSASSIIAQSGMTSTTRATSLPCCGTLAQTAAP